MKKIKSLFELFFIMFKIGIFTFGGGYAMIGILEHEFVEKRKWVEKNEFTDLVAIAESTPGPISINCSTYIGYKTNKILGAIIATLAMCLPSFIIIYLISLFFNNFLEIEIIAKAFSGIRIAVIFLILSAGLKFLKSKIKKVYNLFIVLHFFYKKITHYLVSIIFVI